MVDSSVGVTVSAAGATDSVLEVLLLFCVALLLSALFDGPVDGAV